jgi:putative addiction module killer protein
MLTFNRHKAFDDWLKRLADMTGKARILARIKAAQHGNFGDCAPVGDGVSEMRINFGPGYRVYFVRSGTVVYVLLCGGDKASQQRDIQRAKALAAELKERDT